MGRNSPSEGFGAEKGSVVFWYGPQLSVAESIFSEGWRCMR